MPKKFHLGAWLGDGFACPILVITISPRRDAPRYCETSKWKLIMSSRCWWVGMERVPGESASVEGVCESFGGGW